MIEFVRNTGPFLLWGNNSIIYAISVQRTAMNCKHIFIFPRKYLAPIGLISIRYLIDVDPRAFGLWDTGPWFNIKMLSYQYGKSHCGDKTILRPSYLHNGVSITGKTAPLYWIGSPGVNPPSGHGILLWNCQSRASSSLCSHKSRNPSITFMYVWNPFSAWAKGSPLIYWESTIPKFNEITDETQRNNYYVYVAFSVLHNGIWMVVDCSTSQRNLHARGQCFLCLLWLDNN